MRSGFATVLGRPNVGKSTLVNALVGAKVSITSTRPNTTRFRTRGVLQHPDAQVVFVDTPGLHRPRTALGQRLNDTAHGSLEGVDVVIAVLDATTAIGPGDRFVLARALQTLHQGEESPTMIVVVNKTDAVKSPMVLEHLAGAQRAITELDERGLHADSVEYFPVSAKSGVGIPELIEGIVAALPEGPAYYPDDVVTDTPEAVAVAELVREQLLIHAREELPHSIACRVTEWEWPHIRCEILVERDSQKAMVIGKGGAVLKSVGTAVRKELPQGAYLELYVRVEKRWQERPDALDRLGL